MTSYTGYFEGGNRIVECNQHPCPQRMALKEWTHDEVGGPLCMTTMVSLLKCSGCCLKMLNLYPLAAPDNLLILLQAMPSLEHLQLELHSIQDHNVMHDILD